MRREEGALGKQAHDFADVIRKYHQVNLSTLSLPSGRAWRTRLRRRCHKTEAIKCENRGNANSEAGGADIHIRCLENIKIFDSDPSSDKKKLVYCLSANLRILSPNVHMSLMITPCLLLP